MRKAVIAVCPVVVSGFLLLLSSCGDEASQPGIAAAMPTSSATPSAAPSAVASVMPSEGPGAVPSGTIAIGIPAGSVSLGDQAYGENPRRIAIGTTMTWINNDSLPHTVTSETAGSFDSGTMEPGATFTHTFNEAGEFAYFCAIHPAMRGTILVS
ncbi:MAG: plastocyanin/azurin family copper-binding protein [Oligoflexia bacterium]|nr:plastocyanin/azurin family copper-binding protein [Oligoflexia bacterium]